MLIPVLDLALVAIALENDIAYLATNLTVRSDGGAFVNLRPHFDNAALTDRDWSTKYAALHY